MKDYKRHVFYMMGFDPRGHKPYYQVFKTAAKSDKNLKLSEAREAENLVTWQVTTKSTVCHYDFLDTSKVIRRQLTNNPFKHIKNSFMFYKAFFCEGVWLEFLKKGVRCYAFSLIPLGLMYTLLTVSIGIALAQNWHGFSFLLATLAIYFILHYCAKFVDKRIFLHYLLCDISFTQKSYLQETQINQQYMHYYHEHILNTVKSNDCDEYLIVGHSSGAQFAIELVATLCPHLPEDLMTKVKLLTLGGVHSFAHFKNATKHRQCIALLCKTQHLHWVDIYSPLDWISSQQFDCQAFCQPGDTLYPPNSLKVNFLQSLKKSTWRRIQINLFKRHFLYLLPSETGQGFDYFKMIMSSDSFDTFFNGL